MKLSFVSFEILFTLAIAHTKSASSTVVTAEQKECPRTLCANPVYTKGIPCPSCINSGCNYTGCVHLGAFGPSWKPDNCITCTCNFIQNKAECLSRNPIEECDHLECYGYPTVRKPGKCCPECDFGIAKNECGIIPVGMELLNLSVKGKNGCQQKVRKHGCDKMYIISEDGEWYKCVAINGIRKVHKNVGSLCNNEVNRMTYQDIVSCEKKIIENVWEIPMDYDPEPTSCTLYID